MATTDALIADPAWLPQRFDPAGPQFRFVRVEDERVRRAAFLDRRLLRGDEPEQRLTLDALEDALRATPPAAAAVGWCFHTAFCCSTLLARALDRPGHCRSLREPQILTDLADFKRTCRRRGADGEPWRRPLEVALSLVARADDGERVLIKPSNAANNLIPELLAWPGTQAALLLYGDLRGFLVSVIKKGEACRAFVRRLFNSLAMDGGAERLDPLARTELTDLQIAAYAWTLHLRGYLEALEAFPQASVRTLHVDELLDRPVETLERASALLGVPLARPEAEAVVTGPAWRSDAKDPGAAFDQGLRREQAARVAERYAGDLQSALEWSRRLVQPPGIPMPLPRALL